ncbi:MAG: hypothetical protein IBX46_11180 [Desulfuromonadales bacterium]|nr:hypothetical protein [Desulfuromonadales bacterium]
MALQLSKFFSRSVASRWRQFMALLAGLFLLTILLLLAAPAILSTHPVQNRLKSTLSTSLQGPVTWDSLQLSWTRGLQLHNFTLGPTTGSLHQLRLAEVDCRPGIGFGSQTGETFGLSLFLRLHDLQLELTPPAATIKATAPGTAQDEQPDPLTMLAQGLERFTTLSWPLPLDLRVDIAVTPIVVSYHDPGSERRFRMTEGDLQLRMPSLERAPLTFSLNAKVAVDDHPLGRVRLATEIAGLTAPSGRIVPAGARLAAFVDFPGVDLKADGRLDQEEGLQGRLKLDLPQLQQVAAPFLPANFPGMSGTLLATLQARTDSEKNLVLSCTLAGDQLQVDSAGPLDFNLGQQLRTDYRRQLVTLGGGVLMAPGLLEANWEARIEEPSSPERRVKAKLHQLKIDLAQLLLLAAPFLPPDLPQLSTGELHLQNLELQLSGSQGAGEVRLAKGSVDLQSVRQAELSLAGIALATNDLIIPLRAYFPDSVAAGIDWQIARIDLRGAQPLTLTSLTGAGNLAIAAISKAEGERRLSAKGRFDHKLGLKGAELAGVVNLSTLANDLQLAFALLPDGRIRVEDLTLTTDIAVLSSTAVKELPPTPLRQTLQVTGLELPPHENIPSIDSFVFSISSPELVNVKVEGSLSATRRLTLKSESYLELPRFIAFARPLLPEKLTASGSVKGELQLTATLPERPLPTGQPPLRSAKNALAALRELHGSLQLNDVELRLPLTNGSLHLSGIQTSQPFTLHSRNHGEKIDLGGAIAFDLRAGSVINGQALPVEQARISFSGEGRDWDRAFLAETVEIEPLGLTQHSELTITGLAALLDQPLPLSPVTLLQRLNATLFSEVDLHLRPAAPPLRPDLHLHGTTTAGTRIDLRGNEFLRLHGYAAARDLALTIPDGPELHGLQAHFNLDRTLQISTATTRQERWLPLSASLVQPQPRPLPALLEGARRRLHDDRRGSVGGERSLTIQSLTLPGLAQPLIIRDLEAEIVTGQEEVGMSFLQAELLDGTLRSRALLDLRPAVPVLSAEALFTNLDLSRLNREATLPGTTTAGESSISGEGFFRIPLLEQQRPLLEGLSLATRLRQIGAKSFDRVLASLDPYERNEAIQAQRKLLRLGQLQGIELQAADGALAVSGAVNVQGVTIALPKIDRLRLAELPLEKELAPLLTAISTARPPLEFLRADTIVIDAQGEISLRKEEK